jgi:FixJ family two-component response regulator
VSKKRLVAVIDDDNSFRAALVLSLRSLGYRVRGFASAEKFVKANVECSCDCIITDVHLPGMSGLDLMRLLTEHHSRAPVIMITAHAEPELEARAEASGAICLLRKPFKAAALNGCLARALRV